MSIHFFLVRHGIKEKAIGDVPITARGIEQAKLTAKFFSKLSIEAIISSPLRRADETARWIALETNSPIYNDNRLRERANWGDLPGQSFKEFIEMWEKCTREPDYMPPVGDSVKQACARLSSLLEELTLEYKSGSNIVIVTHGGLITDYLVNSYSQDTLNEFHPNFIQEQTSLVPECSITKITYHNKNFILDHFASTEHLGRR